MLGRVVPEYGDELRREVIYAPYRIVYRVVPAERRIEIVAVVHSARLLV
jgi:plasmid stabilization system protein ParE